MRYRGAEPDGRVDALPPRALARRQVAGLRVEARRPPAVVPDALQRPQGTPHHRPQEGARRDVVLLAAPRRAVTQRLTNALSLNLITQRPGVRSQESRVTSPVQWDLWQGRKRNDEWELRLQISQEL